MQRMEVIIRYVDKDNAPSLDGRVWLWYNEFSKCTWCHNPVVCFVIWTVGIAGSIKGKGGERLKIGYYIGKSPRYRAATFVMDDLVIYNRALSQDEIVEAMQGALSVSVDVSDKLTSTWGDLKRLW